MALLVLTQAPAGLHARPAETDLSRVRRIYEQAIERMQASAWVDARRLLETPELAGFKNVLWNLAWCHRQLGGPSRSIRVLERYLRHPGVTSEERSVADRQVRELRQLTARLTVASVPAGARVLVDGEERGAAPVQVELDPGRHQLEVRSPGYLAGQESLELGVREVRAVTLRLRPLPAELSLGSRPDRAEVLVEGTLQGVTPVRLRVAPGRVNLELRKPGFRAARRALDMAPGEIHRLELELLPTRSTVSLSADAAGAQVFADGRRMGEAPLWGQGMAPGPHLLAVARPGYQSWRAAVTLEDGDVAQVAVRLRRGRLHRALFATAASIAGASLISAGIVESQAVARARQYQEQIRVLMGHQIPATRITPMREEATRLARSSDRQHAAAVGLFVIGGVVGATAGVLALFTRWQPSEASIRIQRQGGGTLELRF